VGMGGIWNTEYHSRTSLDYGAKIIQKLYSPQPWHDLVYALPTNRPYCLGHLLNAPLKKAGSAKSYTELFTVHL